MGGATGAREALWVKVCGRARDAESTARAGIAYRATG
jgi:hypothetical protein